MQWFIEDLPDFLNMVEPIASSNGFLLSAYGSTVRKGRGRDLDLIAVQARTGVTPKYFVEDLAKAVGGKVKHVEASLFSELCALIQLPDGRLIDIQVRLSRCGPQNSMDIYQIYSEDLNRPI